MAESKGKPRKFQVGDEVMVVVAFCDESGQKGTVIAVSERANDSMPYMVSIHRNYREWPFAEWELEHVYDDEESRQDARDSYAAQHSRS